MPADDAKHPGFRTLPVRVSLALSALAWLMAVTVVSYLEFEPVLRRLLGDENYGIAPAPPAEDKPADSPAQSLPPRS